MTRKLLLRRDIAVLMLAAAMVSAQTALGDFIQQGPKLVGSGAAGTPEQNSVALSADGSTAIVGGPLDNGAVGAVWIFTRGGATWTQQGNKLIGTGATGTARQGIAVALSADGNTALSAGPLITPTKGRAGCSPAAAGYGPNRETSWSAPARWEAPGKALPSRCPPTATPPSWGASRTTAMPGPHGYSPAAV